MILAETEASAQQRQANQLQRQIDKLNATLKALPANQAQLVELQQQSDVAEAEYKGLVAQAKQSSIGAFNAYPNVQLLDSPMVDLKPSSPKLSLLVLNAFLASLLGSIALVLLLEGRQPLLSPKDLQAIAFPIVVRIPWFKRNHKALALGTETEVEFQRLASAISLQSLRDRRLLVTSAVVGEGKTSVTLGLARALTDLGFRVLVVDGDFRRAELSRRLGYAQKPFAAGKSVQIQPGLDLLPTLPQADKIVEMIKRGRFEQSLAAAQATGNYDYVVIDSAPVNLTSETALMASIISNVLLVVRPGTSDRNSVNDSLELLAQHQAQIIGLAINGAEVTSSYYPYRLANSDTSLVKL
jgi:Mrp family chromosome partitioning ATPase